jgi:hypothetical protein
MNSKCHITTKNTEYTTEKTVIIVSYNFGNSELMWADALCDAATQCWDETLRTVRALSSGNWFASSWRSKCVRTGVVREINYKMTRSWGVFVVVLVARCLILRSYFYGHLFSALWYIGTFFWYAYVHYIPIQCSVVGAVWAGRKETVGIRAGWGVFWPPERIFWLIATLSHVKYVPPTLSLTMRRTKRETNFSHSSSAH